jgi:hypothetical protein
MQRWAKTRADDADRADDGSPAVSGSTSRRASASSPPTTGARTSSSTTPRSSRAATASSTRTSASPPAGARRACRPKRSAPSDRDDLQGSGALSRARRGLSVTDPDRGPRKPSAVAAVAYNDPVDQHSIDRPGAARRRTRAPAASTSPPPVSDADHQARPLRRGEARESEPLAAAQRPPLRTHPRWATTRPPVLRRRWRVGLREHQDVPPMVEARLRSLLTHGPATAESTFDRPWTTKIAATSSTIDR